MRYVNVHTEGPGQIYWMRESESAEIQFTTTEEKGFLDNGPKLLTKLCRKIDTFGEDTTSGTCSLLSSSWYAPMWRSALAITSYTHTRHLHMNLNCKMVWHYNVKMILWKKLKSPPTVQLVIDAPCPSRLFSTTGNKVKRKRLALGWLSHFTAGSQWFDYYFPFQLRKTIIVVPCYAAELAWRLECPFNWERAVLLEQDEKKTRLCRTKVLCERILSQKHP